MPPKTVTMTSSDGSVTTDVPEEQVQAYADRGFTAENLAARAARVAADTRKSETSAVQSFSHGALSGATLGLSDVAARAIGGEDASIQLKHIDEAHPTAATLGNVAGSLATGHLGAGKIGAAVAERAGGGIAGAVLGGAAEGATFGAGNAVSQLALSSDPLTVEHIASTLGSNILLGGAIGGVAGGAFKLGEKALAKAGTVLESAGKTRTALEGVPEDLAGLDEAGLRAAAQTERASLKAEAAAERESLEQLRVPQREELANQIRDLHTDLATERPIYQAVTGRDLDAIEGISDIRVQLAKSFKSMRSGLDSEISVARDPGSMIRPLEMRQAALEKLQAKVPELQAALAGDARGAALEHVDDALMQTKAQIDSIRALSKSNPVASGRLAMLESGTSPRLEAIEAAREALKKAPEIGLVQKGAETAAFAGGTALAHLIPGVGIAAPFLGKSASEVVGKLFGHLSGAVEASAAKSSAALKSFLTVGEKALPAARLTATKVLSSVKFGPGPEAKSSALPDLFHARSAEIRQQTQYAPDGSVQMRPAARVELAKKLAPIAAVNPVLADRLETSIARKIAYMSSKIPKRPEVGGLQIGPDNWRPSDLEIRSWARTVRACEDPNGVEERLAQGTVTPEDGEAYRTVYPERFAALQQQIFEQAPTLSKTLPMKRKVALSVFTGVPLIPALQPNVLAVLQGNFKTEQGTEGGTEAPKPLPAFGALGSVRSLEKPTRAQQRETL